MKVLAVDYGTKYIGLAFGDTNLRIAVPLYAVKNDGEGAFKRIAREVEERNVSLIIVGLPLTPSGREGQRAVEVRSFVERIREYVPEHVELLLWDERYTTQEAERLIMEMGWKKRKELKDSLSAYVMLLEYIENI